MRYRSKLTTSNTSPSHAQHQLRVPNAIAKLFNPDEPPTHVDWVLEDGKVTLEFMVIRTEEVPVNIDVDP